jgi:large subunit ribosomal protein L17
MRHRKSGRKLGRTASHRKALLISLCTALLKHKRIKTTVAKAKETRMVVEKIITRAKRASVVEDRSKNVHARRIVARYIKDKDVVRELFGEIAEKVATRAGGYTRIVKLGRRPGDGAELAFIELVDFQGVLKPGKPEKDEQAKIDKKDKKERKEKKEEKAEKEASGKKAAGKKTPGPGKKKKEAASSS